MDIGGGTRRRNDVLLDGTPLEAGPKVAYTPPMDAIAEFNVSTNAIDAEFGHSAGGIISMSLKSGTNAYHGTGYYVGRNADWNAVTNRVTRQHSDNTYSQTGGTLGMPLRRNQRVPLHERRIVARHRSAAALADDADGARAGRRLLAVVQRRRVASRHLRSLDVAVRPERPDHSRPVPRQQNPREPLRSARLEAHGEPLGAQRARRQSHRPQQLPVQPGVRLRVPELLDAHGLEHQRQVEDVRARQPLPDRSGAARLHRGRRSVQDAARAGQQAQRLEHRGRHGLHDELDDRAQRARRVLPGRGQARLPGHGARADRPHEHVVEQLVPAVHGWTPDSVLPRNQHGELRHVRRGQRVVADSRGLQPARAVQQVPAEALDQVGQRSAHQARRSGALPLLQFRHQRQRDGEHDGQPEPEPGRPSMGQLPARRAREQLERRVRPDADVRHRDVRAVHPGRLPHSREA